MKWLLPILLFSGLTLKGQTANAPKLEKKVVKRLHAVYTTPVIVNIREVVGGKSKFKGFKMFNDTIDVVRLNVDKPAKYKGGFNNFRVAIWQKIRFTQNEIQHKEKSVYKLKVLIDTLGRVNEIKFVEGLENDYFYTQLCKELRKLNNWKPAELAGQKVNYWLPLVFILKPAALTKTYVIKMPNPLKVKTVF